MKEGGQMRAKEKKRRGKKGRGAEKQKLLALVSESNFENFKTSCLFKRGSGGAAPSQTLISSAFS